MKSLKIMKDVFCITQSSVGPYAILSDKLEIGKRCFGFGQAETANKYNY